ncbi:MAG: hypothetical protein JSU07_13180 [Bacteroidetes bacterium]|nr:hypothetical protein [Bacteroidota bacterium]
MNPLNKSIIDFVLQHQIVTICFTNQLNEPHCINCFYAFSENSAVLILKSSFGTNHDELIKTNRPVSGTIILSEIKITKIKGLQFSGKVLTQEDINNQKLNILYLKKFPLSIAKIGYLWGIKFEKIKFTDNTLGFGSKIAWSRGE